MIVVADTTPLLYLILIEHAHILPALYGRVLIPPAVVLELTHPKTPELVRAWVSDPPEWLVVTAPRVIGPSEVALGPGELEAIALAEEVGACPWYAARAG